jgi:hypothetical protein
MQISGLITGTLGYALKREFLSNAFQIRDVQTFNYEIYSVDFTGDAKTIQNQIQSQFSQVYSGDVRVNVFNTQNSYQFPSDSLKASRFNVSVEIKSPMTNLASGFPELASGYYAGLDVNFWTTYGQYLLDFKETEDFATNQNGNREFNHSVSFGLQTGWSGDNSSSGRRAFAQNIVSGIFAADSGTPFGLYTMVGQISGITSTGVFRNYFSESYDLLKNNYSFSRKREELPFDGTGIVFNFSNAINMATDGTMDVSEKAVTQGKINQISAQSAIESYLSGAYSRCSGIYSKFYNTGVIIQDNQYGSLTGLLPLINTPIKTTKTYDANSLTANYEVVFTNNPTFSGDGTITSQVFDVNINTYNMVEISHTFDYTVNKVLNNSGYFSTLMNNTTGSSPSAVSGYYKTNFSNIVGQYPNMNMVKNDFTWPNVKAKGSAKFEYSNNPSYFVNVNGVLFNILDYTVTDSRPADIINEYKIVNRPTKTSVLSYAYQSERGTILIDIKAQIGKQSTQFFPDGVGSFASINGVTLAQYLTALYQFAGQVFLKQFNYPTVAFNWFISDSKYSFDSQGNLDLQLEYTYTLKKRIASNYP